MAVIDIYSILGVVCACVYAAQMYDSSLA